MRRCICGRSEEIERSEKTAGSGRSKKYFRNVGLAILCVMAAFCACGYSDSGIQSAQEEKQEENVYKIYSLNTDGIGLTVHDLKPHSQDFEGICVEILEEFKNPDPSKGLSPLPDGVVINNTVTGINEITVDFNAEYLSLDEISELQLRAALVETLLNLRGVDSVRFTVESQSLVLGEKEIGPMTADTFIVPTGDEINSYRNATMTLYFPDYEARSLVQEVRSGYYSTNFNMERLVIENLIQGSQSGDRLRLVSEDTLIRDVIIDGSVCTIDFSDDVNNAPAAEYVADPEMVLYAFTNSLIDSCGEDGIAGVKFLVEGSAEERFRDQINLNQVFQKNTSLISSPSAAEGAENAETGADTAADEAKNVETGADAAVEDAESAEAGADAAVEDAEGAEAGAEGSAEGAENAQAGAESAADGGESAEAGAESAADGGESAEAGAESAENAQAGETTTEQTS